MIRILYIHHGMSKAGAARSLSFLIKRLDTNIYEPTVLCFKDPLNIDLFSNAGAKVILDESLSPFHGSTVSGMSLRLIKTNFFNVYQTYKNIQKHIENINPDIIHLNSSCLFIAAKAAKKINKEIPVICHIREPLMGNIWGYILQYMNHKYVDEYIAIDSYALRSMTPKDKPSKIIYNFVDFNIYDRNKESSILRDELNIKKSEVLFLYLARIAPCNGTLRLLEIFKNVSNKHEDFHLAIVGDVSDNNNSYVLKVREACNQINNIHLVNFRKDVPDVIASSDIAICPFTEPHFARMIIEAAAMGVPSIGSNVGGVNELIIENKTGFLFDCETFSDLSRYIIKLGTDASLREEMGKNSYEFAKNNFDSNRNASEIFDIYKRMV
ncbi:MAG: glycosyltransferase family 4 protein [bacterium]